MTEFDRRAAKRIALVSIVLACLSAPLTWGIVRASAEREIVMLAIEQTRSYLQSTDTLELDRPDAKPKATLAARTLSGGLFDIAEIYTSKGVQLAESMTALGKTVEGQIPEHGRPQYLTASHQRYWLDDNRWALRVFIPLKAGALGKVSGYFEGVRVIPDWQKADIEATSIKIAIITGLAALVCGAAIFPLVSLLSSENLRKTTEVLDSHISMMEALGRAIAKRDSDTGAHNYRVAWIAATIGERLNLSSHAMQALIAGSFLHDVGKIGIPDSILLKPGKLDDHEMNIMKTHVQLGEEIVTGMGWLDGANEVVAGHHEKWDGSGYPRQLRAEQIPVSARIFAVADVYDALLSKRPYKDPFPYEKVMSILREGAGTHFDPEIIAIFEELSEQLREVQSLSNENDARALLDLKIRQHFFAK